MSEGDGGTVQKPPRLWRQGDLLIQEVQEIPEGAERQQELVLARGEATGHAHGIAEPEAAELFEKDGTLYLRVVGETATVVHQEHRQIRLPRGTYRVWRQRAWGPAGERPVGD